MGWVSVWAEWLGERFDGLGERLLKPLSCTQLNVS